MKLTNVNPSLVEEAASKALSNIEHEHNVKTQAFIKECMEQRGWNEEKVRRMYDIELSAMEYAMEMNKTTLSDLIRGALCAKLGCKMELETKELRLISNYL